MTGKFIVLEGIDGAGTTTQAKRLANTLGATFTFEPTDHPIGQMIRRSLSSGDSFHVDDRALALLFAADRQEHLVRIERILAEGVSVISDRYCWSSWVYQGLTQPMDWLKAINEPLLSPDLTILLDIDPEIAAQRRAKRNDTHQDQFDDLATQTRLRDVYRRIAYLESPHCAIIDASGSEDQVFGAIQEAIFRIP